MANIRTRKMQELAARLRGHAAETSVAQFRHKFESAALELEEAALATDTRAQFVTRLRLAS